MSEAAGYPAFAEQPRIKALGDLSALPGLEDFAGTAAYECRLVVPAFPSGAPEELWLDLGDVGESSEAWLDGGRLGARICPPHRYGLGCPAAGAHALRIEVTTTLARRLGDNGLDRAMPQGPVGLLGPVALIRRIASDDSAAVAAPIGIG